MSFMRKLAAMEKLAATQMDEQSKREIKVLHEIAKAHYEAGSAQVQKLARNFFDSMDTDGDGSVILPEFLAFMKQEGYAQMQNPHFFKELDMDGNGTLDFFEVMTIYYIIKSGRPFCDWGGKFIPGIFFSCVECFNNRKCLYNICQKCYCSTKCSHQHNGGRSQFLDNYTLLEATRKTKLAQETGSEQSYEARSPIPMTSNEIVPATSNNIVHAHTYVFNPPTSSTHYCNAIVPASKSNSNTMKAAFQALEIGLGIGSISATMCAIL